MARTRIVTSRVPARLMVEELVDCAKPQLDRLRIAHRRPKPGPQAASADRGARVVDQAGGSHLGDLIEAPLQVVGLE